ncbi:aromatic ring-hydroxylating dioxygenase subunit alpha [Hoeflea sp. CAU 1731]
MNHFQQFSLDQVTQPVEQARGLLNEHYTDPVLHEAEKQHVFFDNWMALCFGKDAPEPGDAMPIEALSQPLFVLRGRDGVIRVFQNVCRHRGMILVDKKKRLPGVVRCPYHSWCYDHSGALHTTPHVGGPGHNTHDAIDRASLGLIEIRSHVWQDIVFVNMSGAAPSFTDYASSLIKRWSEFEQPFWFGGEESAFELDAATNWKLAVENYCESYHLPWVHPGLNSYSRLEDHYNIIEPGCFSGQGTLVYRPMLSKTGEKFDDFDGLGEKWTTGAEYVALYPNVLLGVHRDQTFAIILVPTSMEQTLERVAIYYASPAMQDASMADMRRRNAELWKGVFEEDIFVVEGMQKGRHAMKFDGGRFSPVMDGPTHAFHHWVASQFKRAL